MFKQFKKQITKLFFLIPLLLPSFAFAASIVFTNPSRFQNPEQVVGAILTFVKYAAMLVSGLISLLITIGGMIDLKDGKVEAAIGKLKSALVFIGIVAAALMAEPIANIIMNTIKAI